MAKYSMYYVAVKKESCIVHSINIIDAIMNAALIFDVPVSRIIEARVAVPEDL